GGEGRAIVDDGTIGEEDVEDRRLAADLRGEAVLARGGGQTLAEPRARLEQPLVHAGLAQLGEGRQARGARDGVAVEGARLPDVLGRAFQGGVEVAHD